MNKRLIIIALCGMMGLAFASCSRPSIVGTWVEPAGSSLGDVGFTLLENGEVVNIQTGIREYKTWERNGDLLIITGVESGEKFIDTNNIVTLNDTMLVVGDGIHTVTYHRK